MNTPEYAAAALEVAIAEALQPLREVAGNLEAAARDLREAAERGDTARVQDVGSALLEGHAEFALAFRSWLVRRPGAPPWRSLVVDAVAQAPSRLPPGSDQVDRSST